MKDFWFACGHHLLERDGGGGLVLTDEFVKAYLARPELTPPPEACAAERSLHESLLREPRRPIAPKEIAGIADADARENWELMIAFRDRLLAHRTLEAAYVALVRAGMRRTPPLFVNQLVQAILRNALDDCDDPFVLRAAEMLFRPQRIELHEGALIAMDDELLASSGAAPLSPLVSILGLVRQSRIEALNEGNAAAYWTRSDRFDFAFDLTAGGRGHAALAHALQRFVEHVLGVSVEVDPLTALREAKFSWYVGLDAEGTKIGDKVWRGETLDPDAAARLVALFRLTFRDTMRVDPALADEPAYLILAMTPDKLLRMKPQNLVAGLPIKHAENVS